ncbi:hypothetical protein AOLI_G00237210 [Acnodon oligacanthus]
MHYQSCFYTLPSPLLASTALSTLPASEASPEGRGSRLWPQSIDFYHRRKRKNRCWRKTRRISISIYSYHSRGESWSLS